MNECSICYESIYGGYTLECKHQFHEECLEKCRTDICPLCRRPFTLLADVYELVLKCSIETINKAILLREFPVLRTETFNIFNITPKKIILQFQSKENRDKWFIFFNGYHEVITCTKYDIQIDVRK